MEEPLLERSPRKRSGFCKSGVWGLTLAVVLVGAFAGYEILAGGDHMPLPSDLAEANEPVFQQPFSQHVARDMTYFSAAAYSPNPQQCFGWAPDRDTFASYTQLYVNQVHCPAGVLLDENSTCGAAVMCQKNISGHCQNIVLAYRGTAHFNQLRAELFHGFELSPYREGTKVGKYFLKVMLQLNHSLDVAADEVRKCHGCPITITGHSLGGALASLAAVEITEKLSDAPFTPDVSLYTFGQPRTGTCGYAKLHDRKVPNSFRVVNGLDIFPHLPPCKSANWLTTECICDEGLDTWYHHGTEVWYNSSIGAAPQVCTGLPKNEDDACSNSQFPTLFTIINAFRGGVTGHLYYFGIFVGRFCNPRYHKSVEG